MVNLKNKVAFVTGARRGMGRAHALALAAAGAAVAVTDIDLKDCEAVVEEISRSGGRAAAWRLDVSAVKEIEKVVAAAAKKFGRLDILVNNAGVFFPKLAAEMTEADWDRMLDINLKGQFFCAKFAAVQMAKNQWGRIINIASVASGQTGVGIAGGAHYTASKGGITGMSETLAIEFAPLGITVNVIGPGAVDTPMIADAKLPKEALAGMLARIPLKRMGRPEEIAAAAVFLASEEASYITGATLFVDGGWLAD